MLMIPNLFWTKYQPEDYEKYVKNEKKILLAFERTGEMLVTSFLLISKNLNIHGCSTWTIWLLLSFCFMALYEVFWIRYFKSEKRMEDFYSSILKIPVAGASLPVIGCLCLAIYGKHFLLFLSTVILGIGHIGIHLAHKKEIERSM